MLCMLYLPLKYLKYLLFKHLVILSTQLMYFVVILNQLGIFLNVLLFPKVPYQCNISVWNRSNIYRTSWIPWGREGNTHITFDCDILNYLITFWNNHWILHLTKRIMKSHKISSQDRKLFLLFPAIIHHIIPPKLCAPTAVAAEGQFHSLSVLGLTLLMLSQDGIVFN